jgi:hypothetical protein
VIPPDAISPGVPSHPIVLPPVSPPEIWPSPGVPTHPIVLPPGQEPPKSFTVIIKDNQTGEWKVITFVPGNAAPPTFGPGPK